MDKFFQSTQKVSLKVGNAKQCQNKATDQPTNWEFKGPQLLGKSLDQVKLKISSMLFENHVSTACNKLYIVDALRKPRIYSL